MRLQRHTGPITHPRVDPPEPVVQPWEDECQWCGGVMMNDVCRDCGLSEDGEDMDEDEGTDP